MFIIALLRWLTLIGFLLWFVVYWKGGRKMIATIQKSINMENSHLDTALMVIIALFSFVITSTGLLMVLMQLQIGFLQSWVATLGGCLFVAFGIIGIFYCRYYLGRFWTAETTLFESHRVVDKGPYGVVRHPIYTFAIIMFVGLGLVFPTWWNVLSVGIIVMSYVLKARDEDRFLEKSLVGYREYRQRVPSRLFPGL